MRFAVIEGDIIANVIVADPEALPEGLDLLSMNDLPDGATMGWVRDGDTFVAPPPPAPQIPSSVTRYQFKSILAQTPAIEGSGFTSLYKQVEAFVSSDAAPDVIKIAWTEPVDFQRSSPFWSWAIEALGVPSDQIDTMLDNLFLAASAVTA